MFDKRKNTLINATITFNGSIQVLNTPRPSTSPYVSRGILIINYRPMGFHQSLESNGYMSVILRFLQTGDSPKGDRAKERERERERDLRKWYRWRCGKSRRERPWKKAPPRGFQRRPCLIVMFIVPCQNKTIGGRPALTSSPS